MARSVPASVSPLDIPGAWKIESTTHYDNRGSFHELYRESSFRLATGITLPLMQGNCSISARGALRGISFTDVPPGQAKYVTCVRGAVLDVVMDLRVGSPTFGEWHMERLDEENRTALYLSKGLGHGYLSLADDSTVLYLLSRAHDPQGERRISPLDPHLAITWPHGMDFVLSPKDRAAPGLFEAQKAGLLPQYAQCLAAADQASRRVPQTG